MHFGGASSPGGGFEGTVKDEPPAHGQDAIRSRHLVQCMSNLDNCCGKERQDRNSHLIAGLSFNGPRTHGSDRR
jgi:hypothetical protein